MDENLGELFKLASEFLKLAEPTAESTKEDLGHISSSRLVRDSDDDYEADAVAEELMSRHEHGDLSIYDIISLIGEVPSHNEVYHTLVDLLTEELDKDKVDVDDLVHALKRHGFDRDFPRSDDIAEKISILAIEEYKDDIEGLGRIYSFLDRRGLDSGQIRSTMVDLIRDNYITNSARDLEAAFDWADTLEDDDLWESTVKYVSKLTLDQQIDLYKDAGSYGDLKRYIDGELRSLSDHYTYSDIRNHYGDEVANWLVKNDFMEQDGFTTGKDQNPEDIKNKFNLTKLPNEHGPADRQETLTSLINLSKKNGDKISFKDFLEKSKLDEKQDRGVIEFVLKQVFSGNREGSVTTDRIEKILGAAKGTVPKEKKHPITHGVWGAEEGQNTLGKDQIIFKMQLPEEAKRIINSNEEAAKFFNHVWDQVGNTDDHNLFDHPGGFGWIRVSPIDQHSWLIDEIQSDFMSQVGEYRYKPYQLRNIFEEHIPDFSDDEIGMAKNTMRRWRDNHPEPPKVYNDHPEYGKLIKEWGEWDRAYKAMEHKLNMETHAGKSGKELMDKIEKVIGQLFNHWDSLILSAVLETARQNGVTDVYMHTPESVAAKSGIATSGVKINKLYSDLPKKMHFSKKELNLNGKEEKLWHRHAFKSKRARDLVRLAHLLNSME